jgi:glycolate oxidase FAD binding subunit
MHKLHIGALGSLGVITQVTFKLAPLPHVTATTTFAARSAADACAFVLRAHDAGLAIAAAEALSPSIARAICAIDGPCVLLRVSGSASAMARSLHDLRLFAREAGGAFEEAADAHWDQWTAAFMPAALSLRAAVLPSRTADAIHALEQRLAYAQAQISATVSAGVLRANVQLAHEDAAALIRSVRDVVERLGGTLVIETVPRQLKADLDVFGSTRSDFAIMRRLKEQFDPNHTLAPGRFVGRL